MSPATLEQRSRFWALEPGTCFLNHGSYGACPRPVLERQAELRAQLEAQPVRFMARELEGLQDQARAALAAFAGAPPADLVPVRNATTAVASVLASLRLEPGDEVLLGSHAYNACANAARAACERAGARLVVAAVPLPLAGPEAVLEAFRAARSPRTRLALVDWVTSPTALVWPVRELVRDLEAAGVPVLVDGAHAPGMVPLGLAELGASYVTGNLHKWVCAPKGAAFLHARPDRQAGLHPAVVSHGANSTRTDRSRFQLEFGWTGTDDPTPFLCVPAALEALAGLHPEGWPGLMAENRARALEARALLEARLGVPSLAPASMVGSMAAVELPFDAAGLQDRLFHRHAVEVPVLRFDGRWLVRVSLQRHVRAGDVERLAELLAAERAAAAPARPAPTPRRLAAIDVGTNSVLLLVAEPGPSGALTAVEEQAEITRLGRGVDATRTLAPEAIAETLEVLERFVLRARALGAPEVAITATSAARDASNGPAFLAEARARLGVPLTILSGDDEARLTFASAWADFGGGAGPLAMVDIGGGSTEVVVADREGRVGSRQSFDVGSVRLTERLVRHDPPTPGELAAVRATVRAALAGLAPLPAGSALVGIAGTVTTLYAVHAGLGTYDAAQVHGKPLARAEVEAVVARLAALSLDRRRAVTGLQPRRADVIVAGGLILLEVLEALGLDRLWVSDRGLRWGVLQERAGGAR